MNLSDEFQSILDWAQERRIIQDGNVEKQFCKFSEESGELAKAILKKDKEEFIDAVGDIVVTLVSIAKQGAILFKDDSISIESCINSAYNVIKNRKGKCVDGDFIKD